MAPRVIIGCFILMIVGDMVAGVARNLGLGFWNFGLIIKPVLQLIFAVELIRRQKYYPLGIIAILLTFWVFALVITFFNTNNVIDYSNGVKLITDKEGPNVYSTSFTVFNRYILFFLLIPILLLYKNNPVFISHCKKVFEGFFWVNGAAIFLGLVFKIDIFASYYNKEVMELYDSTRFGYKGFIFGINEVSGIYFMGLAYAYRELFYYKRKRHFLLALIVLSLLLTGTKGSLFGFLLLTTYYMARYRFKTFLVLMFPAFAAAFYYIINIDIIEEGKTLLNVGLDDDVSTSYVGLALTLLSSGRNLFIYHNWAYMQANWSILNYVFGDAMHYSETDLVDLYYFFGIGGFLYLYFYVKLIVSSDRTRDIRWIFALMMIVAFIGGHMIQSAIVPIFVALYAITGRFIYTDRTVLTAEPR